MKPLFLAIALLLAVTAIKAQKTSPNRVFEIKPFGEDNIKCCIKYGSTIKFRIHNVNTIRLNGYSLSRGADIDFAPPTGSLFPVKPPEPEVKAKEGQDTSADTNDDFLKSRFTTFHKKEADVPKSVRGGTVPSIPTSETDLLKKQQAKIDSLQKKIAELSQASKEAFIVKYTSILSGFQKIQRYLSVENQLDSMMPGIFIKNENALRTNVKNYISAVYGDTLPENNTKEVINTMDRISNDYVVLKKTYEDINPHKMDSAIVSGELKSTNNPVSVTVGNAVVRYKKIPLFEKEFSYIEKIISQITDPKNNTAIFNKAKAGIALYNRILNEDFIAYTDGQQALNDSLIVTPILKDTSKKAVHSFNPVVIRTTGGIKVNFSTGYLLSFIGDDNYSYYTENNAVKGIVRQDNNVLTNAIGVLIHVYQRSCRDINIAFSSGASITTEGNIGFYLGGSLLFLEKNRLAITAGLSWIKVKKLDTGNLLSLDDKSKKYSFLSTGDLKIQDKSLYQPAGFLGITYNIFSGK